MEAQAPQLDPSLARMGQLQTPLVSLTLQGAIGAAWAKQLGAQKVYVLDDTELYGHGIALVFAIRVPPRAPHIRRSDDHQKSIIAHDPSEYYE